MKIIKATYGGVDITKIVESRVKDGYLNMRADNSIIGDPKHGEIKYLEVEIEIDNEREVHKVQENEYMILPKFKTDRLGIFYADNIDDRVRPCVLSSLWSIYSSAHKKADIITCMWRKEPENPFREIIAWTNNRGHLNQVLQILQCLYTARKYHNYKYVSFLESDVLYPEGYFDYEDFNNGVLYNVNFAGLCKQGFQERGQSQMPTSQITMIFEQAIEHFESILPNALITNYGMLEPQVSATEWNCKYKTIHVNHGRHLTNHYDVYRKDSFIEELPFWGHYDKYKELFF